MRQKWNLRFSSARTKNSSFSKGLPGGRWRPLFCRQMTGQPLGQGRGNRQKGRDAKAWRICRTHLDLMATFYDTHAHLDDERFAADLPQVIERALASGIAKINCIATDLEG